MHLAAAASAPDAHCRRRQRRFLPLPTSRNPYGASTSAAAFIRRPLKITAAAAVVSPPAPPPGPSRPLLGPTGPLEAFRHQPGASRVASHRPAAGPPPGAPPCAALRAQRATAAAGRRPARGQAAAAVRRAAARPTRAEKSDRARPGRPPASAPAPAARARARALQREPARRPRARPCRRARLRASWLHACARRRASTPARVPLAPQGARKLPPLPGYSRPASRRQWTFSEARRRSRPARHASISVPSTPRAPSSPIRLLRAPRTASTRFRSSESFDIAVPVRAKPSAYATTDRARLAPQVSFVPSYY